MVELRARRVLATPGGFALLLLPLLLPCLPLRFQLTDERFRFWGLVPPALPGALCLVAGDVSALHCVSSFSDVLQHDSALCCALPCGVIALAVSRISAVSTVFSCPAPSSCCTYYLKASLKYSQALFLGLGEKISAMPYNRQ